MQGPGKFVLIAKSSAKRLSRLLRRSNPNPKSDKPWKRFDIPLLKSPKGPSRLQQEGFWGFGFSQDIRNPKPEIQCQSACKAMTTRLRHGWPLWLLLGLGLWQPGTFQISVRATDAARIPDSVFPRLLVVLVLMSEGPLSKMPRIPQLGFVPRAWRAAGPPARRAVQGISGHGYCMGKPPPKPKNVENMKAWLGARPGSSESPRGAWRGRRTWKMPSPRQRRQRRLMRLGTVGFERLL